LTSTPCPLPKTHRRLADAHALWHQAAGNYADPEDFRRSLNSALQELRNVTFVLKTEKRTIPLFESWYAPWESSMRADSILRWAVDARNRVVKQGDLGARSLARVRVLLSWDTPPVHEIDVPPSLGPMAIAARVRMPELPAPAREHVVFVVERRWVVETLPHHEVLEALAHCYSRLLALIRDGHSQCVVADCRGWHQRFQTESTACRWLP
jgi:hypothetical protein